MSWFWWLLWCKKKESQALKSGCLNTPRLDRAMRLFKKFGCSSPTSLGVRYSFLSCILIEFRFFVLFVSSFFFFAVSLTWNSVLNLGYWNRWTRWCGSSNPEGDNASGLHSNCHHVFLYSYCGDFFNHLYKCLCRLVVVGSSLVIIVGKIGIARLTVVASFTALFGTLVFILSTDYPLKLFGRALFGLGEGPLEIVMELICMRWFKEGDSAPPSLEFAFGGMLKLIFDLKPFSGFLSWYARWGCRIECDPLVARILCWQWVCCPLNSLS